VAVVQIDIGETSQDRVTAAIGGLLSRAYASLALGEDDRYENLKNLASRVYENYARKSATTAVNLRTPLPPYNELNRAVINQLLDPNEGLPFAARAVLRTQLGLPAEINAPAAMIETNAVENVSTNSATTNSAAK
jgi:hypothetical protein